MGKAPRRAAGGVIVRQTASGRTEVLLVHRPHRQDWTFPKGKVEPGETEAECALREVEEETGLQCVLVDELATISYIDHKDRLKTARYWMMRPVGGRATPQNEVDAVRWLPVAAAARTLTYERDLALLDALSTVAAG